MDKLFSGTLLKNQNWAYVWISSLKFYAVSFYCMSSWGLSKYTKSKLQTGCFYLIQTFLGTESDQKISLAHFLHDFWRKISYYLLLPDQISWPSYLNFVRYWTKYCNSLWTRLWRHTFWNQSCLFCQDKNLNILKKKLLREIKSIFRHL